jgi:hypothetical protein
MNDFDEVKARVDAMVAMHPRFPVPVPRVDIDVDAIVELMASLRPVRAMPARLECGRAAYEAVMAVCTAPYAPRWSEPMRELMGVPILVRDDMDWRAWQFLSEDGCVISGGTVE